MKEIKIYPAPTDLGSQYSNQNELPLVQAINHLSDLLKSIADDERGTSVIRGWSGVSVHYTHTLTAEEEYADKLEQIRTVLRNYGTNGLSREMVNELQNMIGH